MEFAGHVYERPRPDLVCLDDGVVAAAGRRSRREGWRSPARLGLGLSEGFSETEIARELGTSSSSVSQLLGELREELVVRAGRPV